MDGTWFLFFRLLGTWLRAGDALLYLGLVLLLHLSAIHSVLAAILITHLPYPSSALAYVAAVFNPSSSSSYYHLFAREAERPLTKRIVPSPRVASVPSST
ncbi:hypothetical protein J3F83DRAFT_756610 [Trichoderma novae-zelandiae]